MRFLRVAGTPDFLEQKAMGEDFASVLNQRGEQLVFQRSQVNRLLAHGDLPRGLIDRHIANCEDRRGFRGAGRMPQRSPHPRE